MTTLAVIKTWPDQAVVDQVQLKITAVFPLVNGEGANGPWTRQNVSAEDIAGERIRMTVWGHSDLKALDGKEVVISSTAGRGGKLGGIKVKHGSYVAKDGPNQGKTIKTVELEVSKSGNFQFVEVRQKANTGAETASGGSPTVPEGVHPGPAPEAHKSQKNAYPSDLKEKGMRLGMCLKLASDYALSNAPLSQDEYLGVLKELTPKLIAAAKELEVDA